MSLSMDLLPSYVKVRKRDLLNKWGEGIMWGVVAFFTFSLGFALHNGKKCGMKMEENIGYMQNKIAQMAILQKELDHQYTTLCSECKNWISFFQQSRFFFGRFLEILTSNLPDSVFLKEISFDQKSVLLVGEGRGDEILLWRDSLSEFFPSEEICCPLLSWEGDFALFKMKITQSKRCERSH